jgi:alkylhydroperoxidase family enzyme
MIRLKPLDPPYEPAVAGQLERMMPGAPPIGLFRLFARNLAMADAMNGWGRYTLGRQLTISRREREIVIDRTCARTGCEYEWGVHVAAFADRVGLSAEQLRSLTHGGPDDGCWPEQRERLLIRTVDALHDTDDVDDHLWAQLAAEFTQEQLIDLLLLTGWYHAISYVARAGRLLPEPGTPRFADV